MAYKKLRVLIWAKTYPELSAKYVETVCTGGVCDDGTPIRLYPVPLHYLGTNQQYSLYDVIEVPTEKSGSDPRPESYKVVSEHISRLARVGTENGTWRTRRDRVFMNPSWHFASIAALKSEQRRSKRSLGLVTPGKIEGVRLVRKQESERKVYEQKMAEVQQQGDAFRTEYKELEYLPYDVKIRWRCLEHCSECANNPHDMKVLDWGLLELGRRSGWDKAKDRLEHLANTTTHDFRLFMGNFRLHPKNFGIIGLWYPKRPNQLELI